MKKLHSLFIFSILALTMFVGCQMPTDGTGNGGEAVDSTPTETTPTEGEDDTGDGEETEVPVDDTPTVDADEATYGFVKTVNYTVVANGQSLPGTKTGAELIAIAKEKNLVKDTDYTIDGTTVTLTASGVGKYLGYSLTVNASDGYAITGGGMKEAGKTVTLPITHRDGNDYKTPTEPYLVKVHIKEGETELTDIPVTITEDHKIQFTMPEKNINVFAQFCDIRYQFWEEELNYKACVSNVSGNEVMVALCFNCKAYDNLEPVDEKYVLKVVNLETGKDMCFTSLCDDYGIGVIDNDELTILNGTVDFTYKGLQSN